MAALGTALAAEGIQIGGRGFVENSKTGMYEGSVLTSFEHRETALENVVGVANAIVASGYSLLTVAGEYVFVFRQYLAGVDPIPHRYVGVAGSSDRVYLSANAPEQLINDVMMRVSCGRHVQRDIQRNAVGVFTAKLRGYPFVMWKGLVHSSQNLLAALHAQISQTVISIGDDDYFAAIAPLDGQHDVALGTSGGMVTISLLKDYFRIIPDDGQLFYVLQSGLESYGYRSQRRSMFKRNAYNDPYFSHPRAIFNGFPFKGKYDLVHSEMAIVNLLRAEGFRVEAIHQTQHLERRPNHSRNNHRQENRTTVRDQLIIARYAPHAAHSVTSTMPRQPTMIMAPMPTPLASAPPVGSPSSSGLPPNWEAKIDPGSGKMYYVNHTTKVTQWERPAAPASASTPAPAPAAASLPLDWEAKVDPTSGKTYYVNHKTKVTQWERPAVPVPASTPASAPAAASLPLDWEAKVDPTSGKTYFVNHKTKVTQWERPAAPGTTGAAPLPSGWEAKIDPSSGRTFYLNRTTKVTQWHPPPGASAPASAAALSAPPGRFVNPYQKPNAPAPRPPVGQPFGAAPRAAPTAPSPSAQASSSIQASAPPFYTASAPPDDSLPSYSP